MIQMSRLIWIMSWVTLLFNYFIQLSHTGAGTGPKFSLHSRISKLQTYCVTADWEYWSWCFSKSLLIRIERRHSFSFQVAQTSLRKSTAKWNLSWALPGPHWLKTDWSKFTVPLYILLHSTILTCLFVIVHITDRPRLRHDTSSIHELPSELLFC